MTELHIMCDAGSQSNPCRLTFDGVDVMGERLAEEVRYVAWEPLFSQGMGISPVFPPYISHALNLPIFKASKVKKI